MESKEKVTDQEHAELLTLYQSIRDNQQFYMSQQWKVTYYTLLIYSAFIALHKVVNLSHIVFIILLFISCFLGSVLLIFLNSSLSETRCLIEKIENKLTFIKDNVLEKCCKEGFSSSVFCILLIVIIIGAIISAFTLVSFEQWKPYTPGNEFGNF